MDFRNQVLKKLVDTLKGCDEISAVWEGGSAANSTTDQYSDIDFNILAAGNPDSVFQKVSDTLASISKITHVWNEPKSIWPELTQKIYFLKDAPKHFFVDVAFFPLSSPKILSEFLQEEKHGRPVVHFDSTGLIKTHPINKEELTKKQQKRLKEMLEAFPVYRTEVFKELDREHSIDAFAFYQSAMLRPLIEVLGMLYRPYRFDFGLRYLKQSFPPEIYKKVEKFLFVQDAETLRICAKEVEEMFYRSAKLAGDKLLQQ